MVHAGKISMLLGIAVVATGTGCSVGGSEAVIVKTPNQPPSSVSVRFEGPVRTDSLINLSHHGGVAFGAEDSAALSKTMQDSLQANGFAQPGASKKFSVKVAALVHYTAQWQGAILSAWSYGLSDESGELARSKFLSIVTHDSGALGIGDVKTQNQSALTYYVMSDVAGFASGQEPALSEYENSRFFQKSADGIAAIAGIADCWSVNKEALMGQRTLKTDAGALERMQQIEDASKVCSDDEDHPLLSRWMTMVYTSSEGFSW